jgi:hypothetical protein
MNRFGGFRGAGNASVKEGNKGIGSNERARKGNSDQASVGSGSSYGSASSSRTTEFASTLPGLFNRVPSTALPRLSFPNGANLRSPIHLNCRCQDCTKPNTQFLDDLLNLTPEETVASADPLAALMGDMEEFSMQE